MCHPQQVHGRWEEHYGTSPQGDEGFSYFFCFFMLSVVLHELRVVPIQPAEALPAATHDQHCRLLQAPVPQALRQPGGTPAAAAAAAMAVMATMAAMAAAVAALAAAGRGTPGGLLGSASGSRSW